MLTIRKRESCETAIVILQGELVRAHCADLKEAVHVGKKIKAVVLDFSRVAIIDAGGLGALLELRAYTQSLGARLELANPSTCVRRVLQLTHLDSVFPIRSQAKPRARVRLVLRTHPSPRTARLVAR